MKQTKTHMYAHAKSVIAHWVIASLVLTMIPGPMSSVPTATAASSFRPTIFVNTEAFLAIDDDDTTADVVLRFGDTLAKTLTFNRLLDRFEFNDDVYTSGKLTASGTIVTESGAYIDGTSLVVQAGSNNVGIGTATPLADLHVVGSETRLDTGTTNGITSLSFVDNNDEKAHLLLNQATGTFDIQSDGRIDIGSSDYVNVSGTNYTNVQGSTTFIGSNVGIGTTGPKTRFDVVGAISGSFIYATQSFSGAGLSDCDTAGTSKLLWDAATGRFSCGTDTDTNTTYTAGQGLSLNGTSFSLNTTITGSLVEFQTVSGGVVHANTLLRSSGALNVEQRTSDTNIAVLSHAVSSIGRLRLFTSNTGETDTDGFSISIGDPGAGIVSILNHENQSLHLGTNGTRALAIDNAGNIGIGTIETVEKSKLVVAGVISGTTLYATQSFSGAGLSDCDTAGTSKLLWDATTGRFSCGTDTDTNTTYTAGQGLSLNGANAFSLNTTITGSLVEFTTVSGATVKAQERLTSSGTLITESGAYIDGSTFVVQAGNNRVGIGTADPSNNLHIKADSSNAVLEIDAGSNTDATLSLAEAGAERWRIYNDGSDSDSLKFYSFGASADIVKIHSAGNVGIGLEGSTSPKSKLDVVGAISGSFIYATRSFSGAGLSDCDTAGTSKLLWDASTGRFSCGTDQTGSTAYTAGQGLSLNGANAFSLNTTITGALVRFTTVSGSTVFAKNQLVSSGTLVVESGAYIDGTSFVLQAGNNRVGIGTSAPVTRLHVRGENDGQIMVSDSASSVASVILNHFMVGETTNDGLIVTQNGANAFMNNRENGNLSFYTNDVERVFISQGGNVGVNVSSVTPDTKLEVVGAISGSFIYATRSFSGAGLSDCDTAGTSKLLWDATTGRFSCGTDQTGSTAYTAGQGLALNGTAFSLNAFHSGTTIWALNALRSSGALTWEGIGSGSKLFVKDSLSVGSRASGSLLTVGRVGSGTRLATMTNATLFSTDQMALGQLEGGAVFGRVRLTENQWGLSNYGNTWTAKDSNRDWYSIAMSSDGKIQTATVGGGQIYISLDYGNTWTAKDSNRDWEGVVMSSDGKVQTAVVNPGQIYVSFDYGSTWTAKDSSRNWRSVAMSSDGKIQTATVDGGQIYISLDYGNTWTAKASSRAWYGVAMSSDGKVQTAVVNSGQIYVSFDYGNTWTAKDSSRSWRGAAISSDGKMQTAVVSSGQIYVSSDYGNTWTAKDSSRSWLEVTMSSDGKIQTAVVYTGQIYISLDYGNTWTVKETSQSWVDIAMSSDGKIQGAIINGGQIYMSHADSYQYGNVAIGTGSVKGDTKLMVQGILSGVTLYATKSFSGAGLTDCDGGTDKLLWDATTGRFSCGTVTSTAYTAGQGLSLNGANAFALNAYHTGTTIWALNALRSSGALTWEGVGSGSKLFVKDFLSVGSRASGSLLTVGRVGSGTRLSTMTNATLFSTDQMALGQLEGGAVFGRVRLTENQWGLSNYGNTWVPRDSARAWYGIGMSSDGKHQTAVELFGQIYVSTDYGNTWTAKDSSRNWYGIAMSSDGKMQTAVDSGVGGYIYISTDYGNTWTAQTGGPTDAVDIAMSSDGKLQTAVVAGGQIYVSTDYGNTWTAKESARDWFHVAMSSDGKIQAAAVSGGRIYISTDYGNSWTAKGSDGTWEGIAMSSDGKIQAATNNASQIVVSTDYGNTWTAKGGSESWDRIAMSSDGKILTAVENGGEIYVSTDYGNTWTPKGASDSWNGIAMSSDGKIQTAVVNGGQIYVSHADSYQYGSVAIGTGSVKGNTKLMVQGILSGVTLYATKSFSGAGLSDCDNATNSKLLWDATTGRFSCGTDQSGSASYTAGQGLSLNGVNAFSVNSTLTGTLLKFTTLTGSLVSVQTLSGRTLRVSGTGSSPLLSTTLGKPTVTIGGSGSLVMEARSSDPGSAPANAASIFAQKVGGRPMVHQGSGSTFSATQLQTSLFSNQIMMLTAGGGTTISGQGTTVTNDTTVSHPAADETFGYMANFATSTTANDEAGTSSANTAFFRGSTAGANGFFYYARVGVVDTTNITVFSGMANQTIATMVSADNPTGNHVGFQFSTGRGDTNWMFTTKDNSTQNANSTGMAFTANKVYDLMFTCTKQCASITWEIRNVTDGTSAMGTTSSNLPAAGTAMRIVLGVETETTAARNIRMSRIYVESDR